MLEFSAYILLFLFRLLRMNVMAESNCRCLPTDSCWPNEEIWDRFNSSIAGRLLITRPPLFPCHELQYNEIACNAAQHGYFDGVWRSNQPGAMQSTNWEMYESEGCQSLNSSFPCLQGAVPVYTVNVSVVSDIQSAVLFAHRYNLRLVVKSTGHDYLGRSTAPGSLNIWTHHLNTTTFHDSYTPEGCGSSVPTSALSVGAGVQWGYVYPAAEAHGVEVVGAAGPTVSAAGGYCQGGGHSPLSVKYGLCVDNVLQYRIVTADGKLRIANACHNTDLFWALRGGGGGTFGVVAEATYKTYPALNNLVSMVYEINSTDVASYQDSIKAFIRLQPSWSDIQMAGYFFSTNKLLSWIYLIPNSNLSYAKSALTSLQSFADQHDKLSMSGSISFFPSFNSWYQTFATESTGTPAILGSRLIPRKNFETERSIDQLANTIIKVQESNGDEGAFIIGHLVAGGAVAHNKEHNTSVLPAWREALWNLVIPSGWAVNTSESEQRRLAAELTGRTKLLADITPDSGAYLNEADINEPFWQRSFYGSNYPRLKVVKAKYDPDGLFVCQRCVASEKWDKDLNCRV